MDTSKNQTITDEYLSSLADLNVNSKPLINMLTMLADENIEYAQEIVKAVEQHLAKVPPEIKLPILYLIDSIVKNVGKQYKTLFNQSIVNIFCGVFEKVNEKVREKMYNLRQTWNDVFPQTKLYALDVKVNLMDNNWPVTAKVVSSAAASKTPKIHVNPNFLHKQTLPVSSDVQNQLKKQEMELLALQARKLELELQATKQKLEAAQNTEHARPENIRMVVNDKAVNKPRQMMPGHMQQMPPSISGNRQRIADANLTMISNIKSRDPRLRHQQMNQQINQQNQINQHNQGHQQSIEHMMPNNLPPKFFPHQQRQQPPTRGPPVPHYNNMYPNQGQPVKALPKIPKYSQNASQGTSQANKSSAVASRSSSSHRERERKSRDEPSPKSSKKEAKSPHKSSSDESKSPRKKRTEEKDKKSSKSPKRSSSKSSSSTKDVDLRLLPGDQPKKTSRIDNNKMLNKLLLEDQESQEAGSNELGSEATKQDIDLRLLVTETKKRASTDQQLEEPLSKKSKAEKLDDQLFGSEDVDLRALGAAIAFTGPPPAIDGALSKKLEAKAKNASPEAPGRSDRKNFEAVRAKLAEATKKNRDKATSLLIDNDQDPVIDRKRKLSESLNRKLLSMDVDQREEIIHELEDDSSSGREGFNEHVQNFIRQAKEQMEAGKMDEDQYNLLVKQLVRVNENPKDQKTNEVVELSEDDSDASQKSQPAETKRSRGESSKPISEFTHATAADLRNNSTFVKEKRNGKDTKWSPAPVWPSGQPVIPPRVVNPWEQSPFQPATHLPPPVNVVQPQNPTTLSLNNKLRTVRLDGNNDHILRFYDETAIIFDEAGQPHDIQFSAGQSMVIFDDIYQAPLHFLSLNPQPIQVEGKTHMIKFGTPTRELYVDNNYYECYFNNQPTHILLDGKVRVVRINGQVPEVKIGRKRMDLVLGKINLIIDAKLIIPVFLDVKMQYFEFEAKIHSLQFADFFSTVILNNDPYHIEFGGLPKNFSLYGQKHFLRFTALPDNLEPGKINLIGMKRSAISRDIPTPPLMEFAVADPGPNDLDISMLVDNDIQANRDDLPQMLAAAIPMIPNLSIMPPSVNLSALQTPFVSSSEPQNIPGFGNDTPTAPPPLVNLNINDLFKKLVATGILGGNDEKQKQKMGNQGKNPRKKEPTVIERRHKILPISFSKMETIKSRQQGLVDLIYSGMQCSSCGARFPPEQTMKYSQHLDWHFRQNRRERDSQRRAHSRKWYYDCADWIRYEEIEDIEEREKNFFETQQEAQQENGGDSTQGRLDVSGIDSSVAPSCPAGRDSFSHNCALCTDPFEQFFNNKTEEWHLRMAMKVEDKFYHPICYEEHKASLLLDESLLNSSMDTKEDESIDTKPINDVKVKSEKTESEPYEEDDDVMILPNEAPIVTEILDDEDQVKPGPEASTSQTTEESELNNITIDDDVMIQEPKIITENLIESDDEEIRNVDESSQSAYVVKIKEEPKDDDEDNDEDNFMDVATIDNDFMNDENYTNSPRQGASGNSMPSMQDDNDNAMMAIEEESREVSPAAPEPNQQLDQQLINCDSSECSQPAAPASVPNKIKIVLSSLAQQNLNSRSSNSNNVITDSDSLEKNKLEQNGVVVDEVVRVKPYEMPVIEYKLKSQLRDVKFDKIPVPQRRGVENSGLCSIM